AFAAADEGRRVIVVGDCPPAWRGPGVVEIEAPASLAAIRGAIEAAVNHSRSQNDA
ncbi:MAG: hypothetical protein HKN62_16085, partial [Phycisphaerales bacterium]|nr:hypothetical protein [Phycisphaerales bacterium]